MAWWQFAILGGCGGALVEVLHVLNWTLRWQAARRTPAGRRRKRPEPLRAYLDLHGHLLLGFLRAVLGAGAAALCGASGQITGAYFAVAVGFGAPSVLAQLGSIAQAGNAGSTPADTPAAPAADTVPAARTGSPANTPPGGGG